jgi:hypothetical protein
MQVVAVLMMADSEISASVNWSLPIVVYHLNSSVAMPGGT